MPQRFSAVRFACLAFAPLFLAGCGEPGSPQPPSLNLPVPIRNLAAQRTGDVVHLSWTTTARTTDHTRPTGTVLARICRMEGTGGCDRVADVKDALGTAASYDDILPFNLTSGPPMLLTYYVELVNHAQKSAGRSNPAYTADGPAPPAMTGFTASLRAEGVVLHWDAAHCSGCSVRITRLLQSAPGSQPPKPAPAMFSSPLKPSTPSPIQMLEVDPKDSASTIDESVPFGQTYQYKACRFASLTLNGHIVELLGQESFPVTIEARDIFPPTVPKDLAAVADDQQHAIDLSWTADTEAGLAGYFVYRQTRTAQGIENAVARISGTQPLPTPTFRDSDVTPGVTYIYRVSAIDQAGNESAPSEPTTESLFKAQ